MESCTKVVYVHSTGYTITYGVELTNVAMDALQYCTEGIWEMGRHSDGGESKPVIIPELGFSSLINLAFVASLIS